MPDASTGQGAAQTAEPTNVTLTSDVGPRDDAQWLGAFLLAHRGKIFRIEGGSAWGAGPASATSEIVPSDVIDDVVRAVRQPAAADPERHSGLERHLG